MMFIKKRVYEKLIEKNKELAKKVAEYECREKEKVSGNHDCSGYCNDCEHSFISDKAYYSNYGFAYAMKLCALDRKCKDYKKKENENG